MHVLSIPVASPGAASWHSKHRDHSPAVPGLRLSPAFGSLIHGICDDASVLDVFYRHAISSRTCKVLASPPLLIGGREYSVLSGIRLGAVLGSATLTPRVSKRMAFYDRGP